AYIAGKLFVLVGLGPYAPPSPLLPGLASLGVAGSCLLALTVCVAALAWIVLRPWLIRLAGGLPSTTAAGAASATALLISALGGACASLAAILLARFRERPARLAAPEAAPQPLFGPGGHAGPGALGGTRSTLRR